MFPCLGISLSIHPSIHPSIYHLLAYWGQDRAGTGLEIHGALLSRAGAKGLQGPTCSWGGGFWINQQEMAVISPETKSDQARGTQGPNSTSCSARTFVRVCMCASAHTCTQGSQRAMEAVLSAKCCTCDTCRNLFIHTHTHTHMCTHRHSPKRALSMALGSTF